jgi:N6-L-threonylcarbamoyladenine synthase
VSQPRILAIETSCDETAVALLRGRSELLASAIASQTKLHERYGGVVPEVASRNHLLKIRPLIDEVVSTVGGFSEIDVVAATRGPGLLTSLLVGYSVAKGLAIGLGRPFVGVNHLEGHLLSPFSEAEQGVTPCVGLIVSGGHSLLVKVDAVGSYTMLGRTLDDAAGEAFDKVAKLLGLPYPGGPVIDRLSPLGDPERFDLPRGMLGSGDLNFSFSGVKTAVRYLLPTLEGDFVADVCASFQEAVVDVLVKKTLRAAKLHRVNLVTVSGGVSLNTRLRARMQEATREAGLQLLLAPLHLTTDNAAMIAFTALERYLAGHTTGLSVDADPNLALC